MAGCCQLEERLYSSGVCTERGSAIESIEQKVTALDFEQKVTALDVIRDLLQYTRTAK